MALLCTKYTSTHARTHAHTRTSGFTQSQSGTTDEHRIFCKYIERLCFGDRPLCFGDRPLCFDDRPQCFDDRPQCFDDRPSRFNDRPQCFAYRRHSAKIQSNLSSVCQIPEQNIKSRGIYLKHTHNTHTTHTQHTHNTHELVIHITTIP